MKSELIENKGLVRKLKIDLEPAEVTAALDKEFKKIQKNVEIKGFRKGKAPMDQVKAMYSGKVSQSVLESLVNENYFNALDEHKLTPIAMPNIDVAQGLPEEDSKGGFSFTAEFEVRPEITLTDLSKIKVKKESPNVTDEMINNVIEQAKAGKAETVAVLEDRPAQNKDWVKIDFEGTLTETNEPVENGAAKDFLLELGSKSLITGFEEGIEGMKVGQEKTIDLSFPKDYFQKDLAAKPVSFKVTLNSIHKKDFPEVNDEFAKEVSGLESLEAYKEKIKTDLLKTEEQRVEQKLANDLLNEFEQIHDIEVPKSVVAQQVESFKQTTEQRLKMQGMPDESIEDYHKKWGADYEKDAIKGVKTSFLVEKLASTEGLYPNEEDLEAYFKDLTEKTGIDTEKIKSYYSPKEKMNELNFKIMEENVIKFLKSKASIS